MNETLKKRLYSIAKIIISLIAYVYIYFKLKDFNFDFNIDTSRIYLLVLAFLFLFDNWGMEAIKWRFLLKKYEKITLFRAYKSVFSGVTSSVFTPNRVGEFVGRIFYISDENKAKAVLSTIVGSYSQILITLAFGTIAFFVSKPIVISNIQINSVNLNILFALITLILLVFFFNISLFSKILAKFNLSDKFQKTFNSLNLYSTLDLSKILAFSLLRYLVFTLQFVLVVLFFDIDISLLNITLGLAQFYLVLLIIPTISIAEPGIRGIVALAVFSQYTNNIETIVIAISILWLINIVVPTILGSILMIFKKE